MPLKIGRKGAESVTINGNIVVTVEVKNKTQNEYRLVVDAPKDVKILRTELIERDKKGSSSCRQK